MKIKILILFFILNFINQISPMELLVPTDKYETEAKKVKSYLTKQITFNKKDGNTYYEWMLDLCLKHRPKEKSILDYAIKECCTGTKTALKMLLNAGVEIPDNIKDCIDEYLSHRYGTAIANGTTECKLDWPKSDENDALLTSGGEFRGSLPRLNLINVTARVIYYQTTKSMFPSSMDKFCQAVEECEKEKKLITQNTTNLPNDLIGLIFTYLNIIKWKNYHEIDGTQFNS